MGNALSDRSIEIRIDDDVWQVVESLDQAGPQDHVYTLDRKAGKIRFGDGRQGARPPAGSRISATYRTGIGASGNVSSISWQIPASGLPDSAWFTWQLSPDSITISAINGNSNTLRWRLFSWLCRLICHSPWRAP